MKAHIYEWMLPEREEATVDLGKLAQTSFDRHEKLELPVECVLETHWRTREQQASGIRVRMNLTRVF